MAGSRSSDPGEGRGRRRRSPRDLSPKGSVENHDCGVPKKTCVASPFKRFRMSHARQQFLSNCGAVSSSSWLKLAGSVTITGVGFWDAKHGQTGVAPNGIELHPVLGFTGDCHKPMTVGGGPCTRGYSPCLVYHGGADYDCYGGGGNGPYYTKPGVTYSVTGSDPYGLDGDNDGLGCE
jgi:hypothetical protein